MSRTHNENLFTKNATTGCTHYSSRLPHIYRKMTIKYKMWQVCTGFFTAFQVVYETGFSHFLFPTISQKSTGFVQNIKGILWNTVEIERKLCEMRQLCRGHFIQFVHACHFSQHGCEMSTKPNKWAAGLFVFHTSFVNLSVFLCCLGIVCNGLLLTVFRKKKICLLTLHCCEQPPLCLFKNRSINRRTHKKIFS